MNLLEEEEEGGRPQSNVRSAFSGSLRHLYKLYRRVSVRRIIRRRARNQDTRSTPATPSSTTNAAPSTSSPLDTSTTSTPPDPSRSVSAPTPTPGPPEHHKLSCSLRELYTGTVRALPHTRTTVHSDGTTTSSSHRLKIRILPGWRQGTKVTFHNGGSVSQPGHPAADVVYTVEERRHHTFLREGDDLILKKKITLVEALTGYRFLAKTLDGRRLTLNMGCVIPAGFEMAIVGEGMPVAGESPPGRKGKLRVKFEVEFPKKLSEEQKEGLKRLLDGADGSAKTSVEIKI